MTIKMVKLVTGEEIFGDVEERVDYLVLNKPVILVMGDKGLQMVPWLVFAKEQKIQIALSKVVISYEVREDLANGYRAQISGIVTAPANALDEKGKIIV